MPKKEPLDPGKGVLWLAGSLPLIYIYFQILFHYRLLQDVEYSPCAV